MVGTEGLFPPTSEDARAALEQMQAARQRRFCAWYNLFRRPGEATVEDAELVLEDITGLVDRPVAPEHLQTGAVFREGQRQLWREMRERMDAGEKLVKGR